MIGYLFCKYLYYTGPKKKLHLPLFCCCFLVGYVFVCEEPLVRFHLRAVLLHRKIHPSVCLLLKTKPLCDNVGGWVSHNPVMHLGAQTAKNLLIFKPAEEFLYLNGKQAASLALEDATQVG